MFEPIHGSAFDITGKGIANPVATFWTGAQMLEHLGEKGGGGPPDGGGRAVCAAGVLTPDVGGKATTKEVTDAVIEAPTARTSERHNEGGARDEDKLERNPSASRDIGIT